MAIKALLDSPIVAFIALSLALFASGYFTARMRSWFLAVVNWLGAFIALVACTVDLLTENGSWSQFGIVVAVAIIEATLLFRYASSLISGSGKSKGV
jgi:hypothetical protein